MSTTRATGGTDANAREEDSEDGKGEKRKLENKEVSTSVKREKTDLVPVMSTAEVISDTDADADADADAKVADTQDGKGEKRKLENKEVTTSVKREKSDLVPVVKCQGKNEDGEPCGMELLDVKFCPECGIRVPKVLDSLKETVTVSCPGTDEGNPCDNKKLVIGQNFCPSCSWKVNKSIFESGSRVCGVDSHGTRCTGVVRKNEAVCPICKSDGPTVKIRKKHSVEMGKKVKLMCSVSAFVSIKSVSWQHISPEGQTKRLDIGLDQRKYTRPKPNHLVINNTFKADEGKYVCTVSYVWGKIRRATTKLTVEGGPPTLHIYPRTQRETEGQNAILRCKVDGKPSSTAAIWRKVGRTSNIAIDNEKYLIGNLPRPSLVISNIEKNYDEGEYTCEARNIAGPGRNSVRVIVENKTTNSITRTTAYTETNALTAEYIDAEIKLKHADMVTGLAKHFHPKGQDWETFLTYIAAHLDPIYCEGTLIKIVSNLLKKGHIQLGQYDKLYAIVDRIDKTVSHIIKEAESSIKTLREGGAYASNDTPAEVTSTYEGNDQPKSDHVNTQITQEFPEVKDRLGVTSSKGSIVFTFTLSEAKTPHQLSALYLAVTLCNRLKNGQIILKDESQVPLVPKTTPTVRILTENPKDTPTRPIVRLSRRHYRFEEGKVAIVKCVVVDPLETRSVKWFTVKDDGNFYAVDIDNKKFLCGSPKSPSLVISDLQKEDRGIYFCRVENTEGEEEESNMAFVEINDTDKQEDRTNNVSDISRENMFLIKEKPYTEEVAKKQQADSQVKGIVLHVQEPYPSAGRPTHLGGSLSSSASKEPTKQEVIATSLSDVTIRQESVASHITDVTARQESVASHITDVTTRQESVASHITDVTARQEVIARDMEIIKAPDDVPGVKDTLNATAANTRHTKEIHPKIAAISEATHAMVQEKIKERFIFTKGFHDALEKLQNNRVVVIKGNPGDGKTATAIQLLHWLREEQHDRRLVKLHKIKDFDLLVPKSHIVTLVDDIFGENVVYEKDVQEWNKRINSIIPMLCGDKQTEANFLVITVRNEIFSSLKKPSFRDVFTDRNIIDLSSETYNNAEEKIALLELYTTNISQFSLTATEKDEIVDCASNLGFPQSCRLYRDCPELRKERVKFFQNPFNFLNDVLSRIQGCAALLFLFLNNGMIRVKDLDPNSKQVNKTLLEEAFDIDLTHGVDDRTSLKYRKKVEFVKKSLDNLSGFLVVKEEEWWFGGDKVYRFYHDSIYVTVALLYAKKTPIGYIQNCPSKSLRYITTSKTSLNMIVISSDHYTDMCERLFREFVCEENDIGTSIASLDVWHDNVFVECFLRLLNDRKVDLCDMLNKACSYGAEECALHLLSEGVKPDKDTPFCVVRGGCVNVLREILQYDVTPTARDDHNYNVLHKACSCEREDMVTVLCDAYPHLVHDTDWLGQTPLHVVAGTGNCAVFHTVERTVLKLLCRVEDEHHKCESVDGRVVHVSCVCAQYMSQLVVTVWGNTVLHKSCRWGHRELCIYLYEKCPALTTFVDKDGCHCLHYIALWTLDVDMFTECETHVKQYLESTGREYDITTIRDSQGRSVLDLAKVRAKIVGTKNNPLYDHLVKVFSK